MLRNPFSAMTQRSRLRAAVRGAVCVAAAVCAWPGGEPAWRAGLIPALSPLNALLAAAAGAGALFMLGAAALAAVCAFWPRAFCRWLCPTGTCQDAASCWTRRRAWLGRVPQVGGWILLAGLGAALAGYPLFGWLDPLVLFNGTFGLARHPLGALDGVVAAGLPALVVLAVLAPGLWCGKLCPLGALQDLLRAPFRPRLPDPAAAQERAALGRRAFLGLGLGAGYRLAAPLDRAVPAAVLRPPASESEARFTRLCVRCGACVRACPTAIIRFGGADAGWAGVLAPELSFDGDYCSPSCTACGQACPSGAIPRFTVQNKFAEPIGCASLNEEACLLGERRECGACVTACPYGALDLAWDPRNLTSRVVVDPRACTGCGCCEYVCPAAPKAIIVNADASRPRRRRRARKGVINRA